MFGRIRKQKLVNRFASAPTLSQVVKIKMEVQVSNSQELWLYIIDANSIIKQWKEGEEERDNEL